MGAHVTEEPEFPTLDPDKPSIILCVGRKHSGKSVMARAIYRSYPYNKLCVDTNGDADPGPDAQLVTSPAPTRMPVRDDAGPVNLHYRANPLAHDYRDELDRVIAAALYPSDQPAMIWWDEYGETDWNASHQSPHLRMALQQSRHHLMSAVMCCPRPVTISPLSVSQADLIFVYDVPNRKDRARLAENMGYPAERFIREMGITRREWPPYSYLLWDARANQLHRCAPLPITAQPTG